MWAFQRIDSLLKQADRDGSRAGVLDEVVRLGEAFSIVTEYTSFIVLENDGEYKRWRIRRRNALRLERDRASQQQVRDRLESLRQKVSENIGPLGPETQMAKKPTQVADRQASSPAPMGQRRNADLFSGGGGTLGPGSLLALSFFVLAAGILRRRA
jgi:hypothetical protein